MATFFSRRELHHSDRTMHINKNNLHIKVFCSYTLIMKTITSGGYPEWEYGKAKTAVLKAAAKVIRISGPRAATLKNIADEVGITEPAIFRHFKGIDGLFAGLFSVFEFLNRRFSCIDYGDAKGIEVMRKSIHSIAESFYEYRDFISLYIYAESIFAGYPELSAKVAASRRRDAQQLLNGLNEGIKHGDIRNDIDPVAIAISGWGFFTVSAKMWMESGFHFDLCEYMERAWGEFEKLVSSNSNPPQSPCSQSMPTVFPPNITHPIDGWLKLKFYETSGSCVGDDSNAEASDLQGVASPGEGTLGR